MNQKPFQLNTEQGAFRVAIHGREQAPVLVLSNSLGTTLEMWAPQVQALANTFRVVCYDTRGHGGSPITPGPYDFAQLGKDVVAILDALQIEKASFCGISMGGHTGLWLALHQPARFEAVVVCNSAAKIGTEQGWQERAAFLRKEGQRAMQALAKTAPERWFTSQYTQENESVVQAMQAQLAQLSAQGYAACCEALAQSDLRANLPRITIPMLFIAGQFDPVTTVKEAKSMQAAVANAQLCVVAASHLSNIEAPLAFNRAVLEFLDTTLSLDVVS